MPIPTLRATARALLGVLAILFALQLGQAAGATAADTAPAPRIAASSQVTAPEQTAAPDDGTDRPGCKKTPGAAQHAVPSTRAGGEHATALGVPGIAAAEEAAPPPEPTRVQGRTVPAPVLSQLSVLRL
ncbi:hypothetical protein [Streptomyces boninensis]|uniref:hypothetical protein n=1 Tax=Streptomyces boninensis TaxID=2039455 RepID=UPI003B213EA7